MIKKIFTFLDNSRLLQLFLITACVQGGVIVSQFLSFLMISPSEVGDIRSIETILALLVMIGGLGMQGVVVRESSEIKDFSSQGSVLQRVFILIGAASAVTVFFVCVAWGGMPASELHVYVLEAGGVVLLTNLLRASTAFAQGVRSIRDIYFPLTLATSVTVLIHVFLTRLYGVDGWIAARYFGESLCLLVVWWKMRAYIVSALDFRKFKKEGVGGLARSGALVNLSLLARLSVDSLPVLALNYFRLPADQVGYFGVAILSLVLGLLPLTIIAQRALPELVSHLNDKEKLFKAYSSFCKLMILVSVSSSLALMVFSICWILVKDGTYGLTARYVLILALSLPLKAMALSCGTMLLVLRVYGISLKVNIFEGMVVTAVLCLGVPCLGGWAGVFACLSGSFVSASFLFYFLKKRLQDL